MQNVVMNLEQPALIGLEVEIPIGTKPAPCKTSQSKQQGYAVLRLSSTVLAYSANQIFGVTHCASKLDSFHLITSLLKQSGPDFDIVHEDLEVNVVDKIIMYCTRIEWPSFFY